MTGLSNSKEMTTLMRVSLGKDRADLVITGGDLLNVYSGELLPKYSVAVKGKWVACVGPNLTHTIGAETNVIDASGKVVIPGFVDGHAHMIYYLAPHEFLRFAMKGGTTTIVTEIMELTYSLGYTGLVKWLGAIRNQPVKVFSTVPPSITLNKEARKRAPKLDQLAELLKRDEIVGVGEGFWQEVIRGETNFSSLSAESLRLRKTVEGHAAGCRAEKLSAYLAFGVSSCHESISMEEVVEKLRLGLYVMIRQGSIRKELEAIARIKDMGLDSRRLVLVSDGIDPRDLREKGYMEFVVQQAIDLGFDPVKAIQMATLNPAEHFGLDSFVGGIAPGKCADIVIIPEPRKIEAEYVISNGEIIARDGDLKIQPRVVSLPHVGFQGLHVSPSDFLVRVNRNGPINVRVIDQVSALVTREAIIEVFSQKGQLKADPDHDLLKVSLINPSRGIFTGFIRGLGIEAGALATSGSWETFGIVVVGANEGDMALAVNRVSELGGGIVLYVNGQRQAEVPLPVGGVISELTTEEVARRLEAVQKKIEELGFRFLDAALTLATLTTPAIPFFRISDQGLVDLKTGQVVGVIA
jgi:adenine deaminase